MGNFQKFEQLIENKRVHPNMKIKSSFRFQTCATFFVHAMTVNEVKNYMGTQWISL